MDQSGRVVNGLVLAEGISRLGDAVTMVAFPLVAVLVLDASAAELALIGAAQAVPILLMSLPAGAWVDARPRRWPLLVSADIARALLLALVSRWQPLWDGCRCRCSPAWRSCRPRGELLFDVAFAGWVPRLVSGDRLHLANARVEQARSIAVVAGPGIGGALVSLLSAPVALLADAASFVASAALVDVDAQTASPHGHAPAASLGLRRQIGLGLRFVADQPLVRATVATAGINNLTRSIAMAVAILYLVDVGRLSPAEIGLAFAIGNSGFICRRSRRPQADWPAGHGSGDAARRRSVRAVDAALRRGAARQWLAPAFALMLFAHGLGSRSTP